MKHPRAIDISSGASLQQRMLFCCSIPKELFCLAQKEGTILTKDIPM